MCYVEVLFQVFLFSSGDNSLISKCNFNPYVPILSPPVNYSLTAIFDYRGEIIPSHRFLLEMSFWVPCLSMATLYLKLAADLGILCDILGGLLCFLYSILLYIFFRFTTHSFRGLLRNTYKKWNDDLDDCLRVILFKDLIESSNINIQSEICFTHNKCYTRPREMVLWAMAYTSLSESLHCVPRNYMGRPRLSVITSPGISDFCSLLGTQLISTYVYTDMVGTHNWTQNK